MIFSKESLYGWGVCDIPMPRSTADIHTDRRKSDEPTDFPDRREDSSGSLLSVVCSLLRHDFPWAVSVVVVFAGVFLLLALFWVGLMLPQAAVEEAPAPVELMVRLPVEPVVQPEPAPVPEPVAPVEKAPAPPAVVETVSPPPKVQPPPPVVVQAPVEKPPVMEKKEVPPPPTPKVEPAPQVLLPLPVIAKPKRVVEPKVEPIRNTSIALTETPREVELQRVDLSAKKRRDLSQDALPLASQPVVQKKQSVEEDLLRPSVGVSAKLKTDASADALPSVSQPAVRQVQKTDENLLRPAVGVQAARKASSSEPPSLSTNPRVFQAKPSAAQVSSTPQVAMKNYGVNAASNTDAVSKPRVAFVPQDSTREVALEPVQGMQKAHRSQSQPAAAPLQAGAVAVGRSTEVSVAALDSPSGLVRELSGEPASGDASLPAQAAPIAVAAQEEFLGLGHSGVGRSVGAGTSGGNAFSGDGGAPDFSAFMDEGDFNADMLVSLGDLRACVDPMEATTLKTSLARALVGPTRCEDARMLYFVRNVESAQTVHVSIYNPNQIELKDKCHALRLVSQCVSKPRQ